jgi:hypothetical protein
MYFTPKNIMNLRLNSYFRKILQVNFNKLLKHFKVINIIFYILKTRIKNFLLESISKNEIYFTFLIKYLNILFRLRQIIFYVKSEKELNFSLNNKDKVGAEFIVGTSYYFKKKKIPYLNLNLNCYMVDFRILSCKFKDFCNKYKFLICILNTDIIQSASRFKKLIEEKRNRIYLYFNKRNKINKKKYLFWISINQEIFVYFIICQNFFYIKGFLKKKIVFIFKFIHNYSCVKLLNTKISFLLKRNFQLDYTYAYSENILFLENTYSDINISNYLYLQQILLWASKYIPRIAIEEQKTINFFINFENFILIKKYFTHFSNNMMIKLKSSFFINCDFIIPHKKIKNKKEHSKYNWLFISSFSNQKFRKYFYSEINISFNILTSKSSIYNATLGKTILVDVIQGQEKNEESTDATNTEEIEYYKKNPLSSKKNTTITTGNANFYLNI